MNADNATSNDTQTTTLHQHDNSFDEIDRVRCFNHTLQLSAQTLIKPFNAGMGKTKKGDNDEDNIDDDMPDLEEFEDEDGDKDDADDAGVDEEVGSDIEEEVDELEELDEDERKRVLDDTAAVRETVSKVRFCCLIALPSDTCSSFENFPSLLSIPLLLHFRLGDVSVKTTNFGPT